MPAVGELVRCTDAAGWYGRRNAARAATGSAPGRTLVGHQPCSCGAAIQAGRVSNAARWFTRRPYVSTGASSPGKPCRARRSSSNSST
jgi:hypothetical protein